MDPIEIREERVTTGPGVSPEEGVAPPGSTAGGTPPPTAPVSTPPPVAPPSAAPVATTTGVYSSRVSVTPMASRTSQAVWLIAGVIDIVLAMEFIFRAAGANNTGFAHYVYRVGESSPLRLTASSTPPSETGHRCSAGPTCWPWRSTRSWRGSSSRWCESPPPPGRAQTPSDLMTGRGSAPPLSEVAQRQRRARRAEGVGVSMVSSFRPCEGGDLPRPCQKSQANASGAPGAPRGGVSMVGSFRPGEGAGICPALVRGREANAEAAREARRGVGVSMVGFIPTMRGAGICPAPVRRREANAEAAREARRGVGVSLVGFIPTVRGAGICPAPVKMAACDSVGERSAEFAAYPSRTGSGCLTATAAAPWSSRMGSTNTAGATPTSRSAWCEMDGWLLRSTTGATDSRGAVAPRWSASTTG